MDNTTTVVIVGAIGLYVLYRITEEDNNKPPPEHEPIKLPPSHQKDPPLLGLKPPPQGPPLLGLKPYKEPPTLPILTNKSCYGSAEEQAVWTKLNPDKFDCTPEYLSENLTTTGIQKRHNTIRHLAGDARGLPTVTPNGINPDFSGAPINWLEHLNYSDIPKDDIVDFGVNVPYMPPEQNPGYYHKNPVVTQAIYENVHPNPKDSHLVYGTTESFRFCLVRFRDHPLTGDQGLQLHHALTNLGLSYPEIIARDEYIDLVMSRAHLNLDSALLFKASDGKHYDAKKWRNFHPALSIDHLSSANVPRPLWNPGDRSKAPIYQKYGLPNDMPVNVALWNIISPLGA